MPHRIPITAALVSLAVLAGCGSVPESRNLRLDTVRPVPRAAAMLDGPLQIMPFDARGVLGERRLVYIVPSAGSERHQSASMLWEEPPQLAAAIVMAEDFRAAGLAPAVLAPDHPGISTYSLSARIGRFELVNDPEGSHVAIGLDVTAFKGPARAVMLSANYCATDRVAAGEDVAQAFDRAYGRLLKSVADDLAARADGKSPAAAGGEADPC